MRNATIVPREGEVSDMVVSAVPTRDVHLNRRTAERWLALLLLPLVVAFFFNPGAFFFWDEWQALHLMATTPFSRTLFVPHNEHILPLFRVYFYLATSLIGENYGWYIILNCIVHTANCCLLARILRYFDIRLVIAWSAVVLYALNYSHWDNVSVAFQMQILLAVFFLLAALLLHVRPRAKSPVVHISIAILSWAAAWSFSTGMTVPCLMLALSVMEIARSSGLRAVLTRLGALWPYIVVTAVVTIGFIYNTLSHPPAPSLGIDVITEPWRFGVVGKYVYLTVYSTAAAVFGPFLMYLGLSPHGQSINVRFAGAVVLLVVLLTTCRRSPKRYVMLGLFAYQLLNFGLISRARLSFGDGASFASRYQLFGELPVAVACACVIEALWQMRGFWPRAVCIAAAAAALGLWPRQLEQLQRSRDDCTIRRGVVIRDDYERDKSYLMTGPRAAPDFWLSRYGFALFPMSQLAPVMAHLDPASRSFLPRMFVPTRYFEQQECHLPHAETTRGRASRQEFTLPTAGKLCRIEVVFATFKRPNLADCDFEVLDDGGNVIASTWLSGRAIIDNYWVGVNFTPTPLESNRPYSFRVQSRSDDPNACTSLYVRKDASGWPFGGAVTRDGVKTDLTFRIWIATDQ